MTCIEGKHLLRQLSNEPARQAMAASTTNRSSHPHNLSRYRTSNLKVTAIALKHYDSRQLSVYTMSKDKMLTRKVTTTPIIVSGRLDTGMWVSTGIVESSGEDNIFDCLF
jgi:hypothetical protein